MTLVWLRPSVDEGNSNNLLMFAPMDKNRFYAVQTLLRVTVKVIQKGATGFDACDCKINSNDWGHLMRDTTETCDSS